MNNSKTYLLPDNNGMSRTDGMLKQKHLYCELINYVQRKLFIVYDVTEVGVATSDELSEALLKPDNNKAGKTDVNTVDHVKHDVLPLST